MKKIMQDIILKIENGFYDELFTRLYCIEGVMEKDEINVQRMRYIEAVKAFNNIFGGIGTEVRFFSSPGRVELCGNHTDHNDGIVLAGSINLDIIGVALRNNSGKINVVSEGYDKVEISLEEGQALLPLKEEKGSPASLVRGMVHGFIKKGYRVQGFDLYTQSDVPTGGGLSSSAAFEVLIGNALKCFSHAKGGENFSEMNEVEIAKLSQETENLYFGKPCGLMDQMACSVGGVISIDFKKDKLFNNKDYPLINRVNLSSKQSGRLFADMFLEIFLVDTKGSHADLTEDYSAIPAEMKSVANYFGKTTLRELEFDLKSSKETDISLLEFLSQALNDEKVSQRAVLRAFHFFRENERVIRAVEALKGNNFDSFKTAIIKSGESSVKYLQNIYPSARPNNQSLSLALAAADEIIGERGAFRIHGGGFAGSTLNFVPQDLSADFVKVMETLFGKGCCRAIKLRTVGGCSFA